MTSFTEANKDGDRPWILQLCHGYDGPFMDCARQYAAAFENTKFQVCTVYLTGEPSEVVEAGSASDKVVFLNYCSRQLRGLKLQAILDIHKLQVSHEFVMCIAHRFKPTYVALFATQLPVISVSHAFGVYHRSMRRLLVSMFKSRLTMLGVSMAVRDDLRKSLPGWPEYKIQHMYNRINPEALTAQLADRNEARAVLGLPESAWIVGNVGRLHPDKDQATLIRGFAAALPSLPEGSLLAILGRGRLEQALRQLAEELNVSSNVLFLGQVPEAKRYFKAFDVFALSSDHEPFGMVLLEAMIAGVPIIATRAGGATEIVDGIGEMFELGDSEGLARCLVLVSASNELEIEKSRRLMKKRIQDEFSDKAVSPLLVAMIPTVLGST